MSSQDVVNWTRHQIAEKKSLEQICEDMMSRCLSPDSDVAGGIGCDNMTVLVVALLGGRTLDEWYTWVGERVENKVGYDTPRSYPSLYPPPRIGLGMGGGGYGGGLGNNSYGGGNEAPTFLSPSWLQRLNRPLYLSQAGISSILPVSGNSAGFDDSDDGFEDEDSDEEMGNGGGTSSTSSGTSATADSSLHAPPARDSTSSLRAQLEALDQRDRDVDEEMGSSDAGSDGQQHLEEDEDEEEVYNPLNPRAPKIIGAPLIPAPQALADLRSQRSPKVQEVAPPRPATNAEKAPIVQAQATPAGDAPSGAVKEEGLMDSSEAPNKM